VVEFAVPEANLAAGTVPMDKKLALEAFELAVLAAAQAELAAPYAPFPVL
jgi:hypothetical protein